MQPEEVICNKAKVPWISPSCTVSPYQVVFILSAGLHEVQAEISKGQWAFCGALERPLSMFE